MIAFEPSKTGASNPGRDLLAIARRRLGGRRGLLILGAVAIGAGLASSWGWLVAVGVAPMLVSVLPCAAMCALGLCMHGTAHGPGAATTGASDTSPLGAGRERFNPSTRSNIGR